MRKKCSHLKKKKNTISLFAILLIAMTNTWKGALKRRSLSFDLEFKGTVLLRHCTHVLHRPTHKQNTYVHKVEISGSFLKEKEVVRYRAYHPIRFHCYLLLYWINSLGNMFLYLLPGEFFKAKGISVADSLQRLENRIRISLVFPQKGKNHSEADKGYRFLIRLQNSASILMNSCLHVYPFPRPVALGIHAAFHSSLSIQLHVYKALPPLIYESSHRQGQF